MLRIGLTGGIGCGKTTVAAMLRELGCAVIAADGVAHRLIEPGQAAHEEIVHAFGEKVLAPDRRVDRQKLAAVVFGDPAKLAQLNRIVHPRVLEEVERTLGGIERAGTTNIVVIEAALLVEAGYQARVDRLAVAWCRPGQQIERLRERGMTTEQARGRVAAQMPIEEKKRLADDLIDCSGTIEETRQQVEGLLARWKSIEGGTATARAR